MTQILAQRIQVEAQTYTQKPMLFSIKTHLSPLFSSPKIIKKSLEKKS